MIHSDGSLAFIVCDGTEDFINHVFAYVYIGSFILSICLLGYFCMRLLPHTYTQNGHRKRLLYIQISLCNVATATKVNILLIRLYSYLQCGCQNMQKSHEQQYLHSYILFTRQDAVSMIYQGYMYHFYQLIKMAITKYE